MLKIQINFVLIDIKIINNIQKYQGIHVNITDITKNLNFQKICEDISF